MKIGGTWPGRAGFFGLFPKWSEMVPPGPGIVIWGPGPFIWGCLGPLYGGGAMQTYFRRLKHHPPSSCCILGLGSSVGVGVLVR